jgi:predicted Zn-dependent protease
VRRDGHNIPAFNSLLNIAREQIAQAKWADAEQTLTRAQRMAPDSPAVYAHFAEIAIQRQQWTRADSMARRGLLLTQNPAQQRTFWQIVLLSAQQQNNTRGVQEAQRQLSQLR